MSHRRIDLGKSGEEIAADYLKKKGFQIITRNYRHKSGEIDIIARDGTVYVFIEVKTRRDCRYGSPAEAVTVHKQRQICRAAEHFLARHDLFDAPARFDVIAVLITPARPEIEHITAAFDAP